MPYVEVNGKRFKNKRQLKQHSYNSYMQMLDVCHKEANVMLGLMPPPNLSREELFAWCGNAENRSKVDNQVELVKSLFLELQKARMAFLKTYTTKIPSI